LANQLDMEQAVLEARAGGADMIGELVISGSKPEKADADDARMLHRGIAERAFERRFKLADHVRATGARLEDGLLHVELVREVPEELKPRKIAIQRGALETIDA
ncbi:MAG: Hsp20 family protein, partial [Pseudomonadota bacterium]